MRRPFLVGFSILTILFVLFLSAAYVADHRAQAPWRDGWAELTGRLGAGKARIDSLETELSTGRRRVGLHRARLDSLEALLADYERRAVGGRLPGSQHRAYLEVIEAQNESAVAHNEALAQVRLVYEGYSGVVRAHNAVIDSANRFRREAAGAGVRLEEPQLR